MTTHHYSTSDQTLDNQNEEELQSLHGKIKQLRSVRLRFGAMTRAGQAGLRGIFDVTWLRRRPRQSAVPHL